MIRVISEVIAKWLELEGVVVSEERTLYSYAAYSFLFGILPIGMVMLLGMCFGMLREGITLIIPFMMLRKFSGGFHLESSSCCFVATVGVLSVSLRLVAYIVRTEQIRVLSYLVCLSVLSLCIFSPVENQARKISPKERIVFRTVARILSLIYLVVYTCLSLHASIHCTSAFGVGILLVAIMQYPCILGKIVIHLKMSKQKAND